jgi:hypothetical protein
MKLLVNNYVSKDFNCLILRSIVSVEFLQMLSRYRHVAANALCGSIAHPFVTNFNLGTSYECRYSTAQENCEKQCNEYDKNVVFECV